MAEGMCIVKGTPIAAGVGIGVVLRCNDSDSAPTGRTVDEVEWETEWSRFLQTQKQARAELEVLKQQLLREGNILDAALFDVHKLMVEDPELVRPVKQRLKQPGNTEEDAVTAAIERLAQMFETLADGYLQRCSGDILDVGSRLMRGLSQPPHGAEVPEGRWVVAAEDLLPSQTAALDLTYTAGLLTIKGGATSHAAILARARGIPAVVVPPSMWEEVSSGDTVIIDGTKGEVIIRPTPDTLACYRRRQSHARQAEVRCRRSEAQIATTMDGEAVVVAANVGSVEEAWRARAVGADGIGMLRTEMLYVGAVRPPSEQEQLAAYREIARAFSGKPLVWRTLDATLDKPVMLQRGGVSVEPALNAGANSNRFLGLRGIRFCLQHRDLFAAHLRAMAQSVREELFVMFPMVTAVAELRQARALLNDVLEQLRADNVSVPASTRVGIMVETPAAALSADKFAPHVDFFCLGTNHLVQFGLGVDRSSAQVAHLYQPYHPGMLRMMAQFVEKALAANKPVTVCGELAGDPLAVALFIGMGVRRFSVAPDNVPRIKRAVRTMRADEAQAVVPEALQAGDGETALAALARLRAAD